MSEEDDLRFRVSVQHRGQVSRVDRLSPLELEAHHVGAVSGGEGGEPLAEVAAQRSDDLVARRYEVRDRRFKATRSGAREHQEVVGRLEHALGAGGDLRQDVRELRAAVIDHRAIHAAYDTLRELRRAGDP